MPTFILNDETKVNSYGFRVPNSTGDFSRFDANPVMTDTHQNIIQTILGAWQMRRVDGNNLLADTNFDSADPNVKPIEDKVNRGFIKGASMGITCDLADLRLGPDGVYFLSQWQLMEAAICAIPSNPGAVMLYNTKGILLSEGEVKTTMLKLGVNGYIPLTGNNVNFSMVRTPDDFEKLSHPEKLEFKNKHLDLYAQLFGVTTASVFSQSTLQAQLDFQTNRINAKFLSQPVNYNAQSIRTIDDFQKLSTAEALDFKAKNMAAYKALFL